MSGELPPPELTKLGAVVLDMPGESVVTLPPRARARWILAGVSATAAATLVAALVITRGDRAPSSPAAPVHAEPVRVEVSARVSRDEEAAGPRAANLPATRARDEATDGKGPGVEGVAQQGAEGADVRGSGAQGADVNAADGKSADAKSADGKSADAKSADAKSADGKSADAKSGEVRADGGRASDARVAEKDASSGSAADEPPADRGGSDEARGEVVAPHAELRRLLRELRASSSRDNRRYVQLLEGLSRAAARLEPGARRAIEGELSAAELTYDVDALARALATLMKAESGRSATE